MAKDYELEINDKDSEFGEPGPQGEPGKDGRDGKDGSDGKDGRNGKDGKDGIKGDTGPRGLNGIKGPAGSDGKNGKDGINGLDGRDGKDGQSLQFKWDGTKLGIKKTSDDVYKFTELAPKTVTNSTQHQLASSPGRIRATTTGSGSSLINGQANNHVTFKSLAQGINITLVDDGNTITINSTGGGTTLTLTTIGTSGAATLVGSVLNIPNYSSGSGTVTAVSVVSANGFAGTVANSTSTPAITISTTITGLLKGNGTAISAATAGTDYQIPISLTTTGTSGAATFNTGTGVLNIPQYATTSLAFSGLTSGTNTAAAMLVGTGASLGVTGTGTIVATSLATPRAIGIGGSTGLTATGVNFDGTAAINPALTGTLVQANGGTGFSTYTLGDTLYASATNTLSKLAGNTTATKQFLSQTGTGTVSAAPAWGVLASADIPNNAANTTGSAAKLTTARTIAGTSFDGSANIALANKFIVQGTTDAGLSGAQFLGALGTGLVKNTTTTGILSIATAGTDYQAPITLTTIGSGAATFISNTLNIPTPSGSAPGGSTTQIQYNNAGAFAGATGLTTTGTNLVITDATATAFAVGATGSTNPAVLIDASTASSATGLTFKSAAAGGGYTVTLTSSGTNEASTWNLSKGSGNAQLNGGGFFSINAGGTMNLQSGGSTQVQVFGSGTICTYSFRGFTGGTNYTWSGLSDTNLTGGVEAASMDFNFAQTKTHGTGAVTLQRDFIWRTSTHAYSGAVTVTDMVGMYITGAPIAGTSNTSTRSSTLYLDTNAVGSGVADSFAINAKPNTGATRNWGIKSTGQYLYASPTPTIAAGAGAGTTPTIAIAGTHEGGIISLTTGTTPTLSAVVATITYANAFPTNSSVVLYPANAATALLSGTSMLFTTGGTTNFTMTAGTVALTAATAYKWNYVCIGF